MQQKSLYEILEVHREASPDVIRAAYKSLAAKYHPDRDGSAEAARRFAEIQLAYDVLSDANRRRQYEANPESARTTPVEAVAVLRVDGSSTFLTLAEHQRRQWQEAAGCDLSHKDFSGVSFQNAKLSGAKLDGSRFTACDFRGADLTNCSAKRCQFDRVDFAGAKIVAADFSGSSIRGAKFFSVGPVWMSTNPETKHRFTDDDFLRQKLRSGLDEEAPTVLFETTFTDADLSQSRFAESSRITEQSETKRSSFGTSQTVPFWLLQSYPACKISKCNFTHASLMRCQLSTIDLSDCVFDSSSLVGSDLSSCRLADLDLSTSDLLDANLASCIYSDVTKFPIGYRLPKDSMNVAEIERTKADAEAAARAVIYCILIFCSLLFLLVLVFIVSHA